MKNKKIIIKPFKMVSDSFNKGFNRGLVMKREVNIREVRYIVRTLLGIEILKREDADDLEEYYSFNEDLLNVVNDWLKGKCSDNSITEYAYDCSDEPLGIWNAFKIVQYLQKKNII